MAHIAVREKEDLTKGTSDMPEEEKSASESTTTASTTGNSEDTSQTEDGEKEKEGAKEQYKLEVNQAIDQNTNNKAEAKETKDSNKLDVPEAKQSRSRRGSGSLSSSLSSLSSLSVPAIDRFLILCYVIVKAKLENMWSQYCYLGRIELMRSLLSLFVVDFIKPEGERSEFLTALNDLGTSLN